MKKYEKKIAECVETAKEKIERIKAADSLVFPIFSDLHTVDENHEFTKKLVFALKTITDKIDYEAVINLGDNMAMLGREIHITNNALKKRLDGVFSAIYDATKHPLININGNHDAIGTDFFKADFWNDIVKGKWGNTAAVYENTGAYYYIDYEKSNTRLVVLSLPFDSDTEAEMPTPLWRFGDKQLKWLKQTALNTDKKVIILSHVPFYYKYTGDMESTVAVWDGTRAKTSYAYALCGGIEDLDAAIKIIDEFNAGSGEVIACLSGHTHADSLWMPYEQKSGKVNPLPCCQAVIKASCFDTDGEPQIGVAVDVAVWTPSKTEFSMIRIGDGADRKILI